MSDTESFGSKGSIRTEVLDADNDFSGRDHELEDIRRRKPSEHRTDNKSKGKQRSTHNTTKDFAAEVWQAALQDPASSKQPLSIFTLRQEVVKLRRRIMDNQELIDKQQRIIEMHEKLIR
eukprot:392239_1